MDRENIHPASFRDSDGYVFLKEEGVFRRMKPETAAFVYRLFDDGVIQAFTERDLMIDTAPVTLDAPPIGYDARALWHDTIPLQTLPWEWSFEMRRQAAMVTVELLEQAHRKGLNLKDGTPLNVAFVNGRMVWFDTLSLTPLRDRDMWNGYRQFCRAQLFPLLIESNTDIDPNPWLRGDFEGVSASDTAKIMGWSRCLKPGVFKHVLLQAFFEHRDVGTVPTAGKSMDSRIALSHRQLIAVARNLNKLVSNLKSPRRRSGWRLYASNNTYSPDDERNKQQAVEKAVVRFQPRQVVDLGCNTGVYTRIAVEHAGHVIAVDADSDSIDTLLEDTSRTALKKVTPIVANLMSPGMGHGWYGRESEPLIKRIRSDMFLALALVHHLCVKSNLPITRFVDLLCDLASQGIVEWIGKDDPMVRSLLSARKDVFPDYTEQHFVEALKTCFSQVDRIPLQVDSRCLFIVKRD